MVRVLLENVTKRFGNFTAVNRLNLEVKDKEFACLLGPSGCGKTTTLRCIAGLDKFTEGNVYFDDILVNDLPPQKRDVGMVFQFYVVYRMSVAENLAFPLKAKKTPREEIGGKVKEIAEVLRISHLLNKNALSLTPAEKQMVALGRALIKRPKVLLLDEPLTNLDAKFRAELRIELKRIHRELKTTTIYVTHDQLEAITMADRIAVMDQGILQQYGTPREIYEHPANMFVAGFIGSPAMNFLEGTYVEKGKEAYIDFEAFTYPVSEFKEAIKREATSAELIMGIRPEHVNLNLKPANDMISGEVYMVERLGDKDIVDVKIGDKMLRAIALPGFPAAIGDKIWVAPDKNKLHIIDKKTEKVIV
jgi:multiple sugar transport system ATP-binding protein